MSANFYDLLKYAATGIASPSMTYFGKMRASTLMGGVVQTLTGIPPLSFKADGTPIISWSMKGNGSQTGTPTPDVPIMPTFCGVRTGNLVDVADLSGVGWATQYPDLLEAINSLPNGTYTMSMSFELTSRNDTTDSSVCGWYLAKGASILSNLRFSWRTAQIGEIITVAGTFTINDNNRGAFTALYLYGCGINGTGRTGFATAENIMINDGSTALPYEPFGWAEYITCGGQTVPVYLGQTQTVRKIKKLVLTGGENIRTGTGFVYVTTADTASYSTSARCICTHYPQEGTEYCINTTNQIRFYVNSDADTFKAYLAQQYANSTPVIIWYVLLEPETAIVNEPLCKIGDYADELHSTDAAVTIPTVKWQNTLTVDTELQPSEMTITYKG